MSQVEIDLSGLKKDKKGEIIWKETIGEMIPFIYNNEVDYLKVIGYCKQHITLELNGRVRKFHVSKVYHNHIEPLLGIYTQKFFYEVGEVVGDFKILEQIFIVKETEKTTNKLLKGQQERKYRGYKVECLECGKQYEIEQKKLNRVECEH